MSVQFGRWSFDEQPVQPEYIEKVNALLSPYAPDGCSFYSASGLAILYHAFHTTKESRREKQPHISNSGAVITWDGRLDNRAELIRELTDVLTASSTDVEIVAAAYEEWGETSFAKLIGDWAVSIWNPATRSLILAKDVIGTRHLYYAVEEQRITWSTILDPLVMLAGRKFQLCEEYIAGWLGFFPATHLTPYVGIDSIQPSSSVRLQRGKREIRKYWDFNPHKRIRYQRDGEYEEHFRNVFGEAVRRRLRSDTPVVAELSGGMDSSSIVCTADEIIARGLAETPCLHTISYYDDSEPNWNERPYFERVEEKRGHKGCHIDIGTRKWFRIEDSNKTFPSAPSSIGDIASEADRQFANFIAGVGSRVVLSGVGGDEVTGGVPTPVSELQDLLSRLQLRRFAQQLKSWALAKRRPWFRLLMEAIEGFLPSAIFRAPSKKLLAPWLDRDFAVRNAVALIGYESKVKVFGPLPSFQQSIATLDTLRRQLACSVLTSQTPHEKRYPYLDPQLLEFMFAVPRDQLVRPRQRRSLVRRALSSVVPDEILNRNRKAFVSRTPIAAIRNDFASLIALGNHMIAASLGIVDANAFCESVRRSRNGEQIPIGGMLRSFGLELWLRALAENKILNGVDRCPILDSRPFRERNCERELLRS